MFSAASSTSITGATSDWTDRMRIWRIGGVDLAIGRRTWQILRQLPGGGVDRSLDVVGGGVDVAVEVELDGDRGRAERARRRHLRDAGYLRDLPFERLGDRGRHRVGEAPGSEAETVMVGKSTCGRGATGSDGNATRPTRSTATISSVVAIGRWMKGAEMPLYIG